MNDQWTIRGVEFVNCNCDHGCPCQFGALSTHGHCEAISGAHIEEGRFNDARLDGLNFVMLVRWPGEIAEGNGRQLFIIDERADEAQRAGILKILKGECTAPGSTIYNVFSATMSEVLEPIYAPVNVEVDVEAREARIDVPGMVEAVGEPMKSRFTGEPARARIELPDGFEYTVAEMGAGRTKVSGAVALELDGTYGQFNILHMNQDGVVR